MSTRDDIARARTLLNEGRSLEAEAAASRAVLASEKEAERRLLPEALMVHGAALARLGDDRLGRMALARAASLAERAKDFHTAGTALLTLIEEVRLPADELRSIYHDADKLLSDSQDISTLARLRNCARRVFNARLQGARRVDEQVSHDWEGCSLDEEVLNYERKLIQLALDTAQGKVTQAAELLGITHQSLSFILKTRHKDLLEARRTPRPRRRSNRRTSSSERAGDE